MLRLSTPERITVKIAIDLSTEEIAAIKQLTRLDDVAAAISRAAREFLRLSRLRDLKSASGNVDYVLGWENLEELELGESSLPE